jgi:hypothetical protein
MAQDSYIKMHLELVRKKKKEKRSMMCSDHHDCAQKYFFIRGIRRNTYNEGVKGKNEGA